MMGDSGKMQRAAELPVEGWGEGAVGLIVGQESSSPSWVAGEWLNRSIESGEEIMWRKWLTRLQ